MAETFKGAAKQMAIEGAVKLLDTFDIMPSQLFVDAKMFAEQAEENHADKPKGGETNGIKHREVREKLMFLFGKIADTVFDLAIKLAVLWLKAQVK